MTYTFGQTHPRMIDPETLAPNVLVLNISKSLDDYRERCNLPDDFRFNTAHIMSFTQRAWRLSPDRANRADLILATVNVAGFGRLILGAFIFGRPDKDEPEKGISGTGDSDKFTPSPRDEEGRYIFLAEPALPQIWNQYVGNFLPATKQGEANPVRYYFHDSKKSIN